MAAKKESVAKCAGSLLYGVGRPDGVNTMIKTIQYFAEADTSRVLVALDLKAVFQNVSRRAMLYSIAQTDADLAAVFSKWYTGTTEHRMHYDSAYTKITANSGVDQSCPLSACGFSAVVDPALRSVMAQICTHYDSGVIRPPGRLVTVDQTTVPTTDTCYHHCSHQISQPCPTVHPSFKTSSNSWPCFSGRAGHHGEDNTTLSENCHHTCRPQC